ncbi:MAG: DUF1445 domain-containing protein, partial [Bacillota bacterium]
MRDIAKLSPHEARMMIRRGEWVRPTPGIANGYVQANLVVLRKEWAFDFLLFCQRNPKPCPVLDVTEPGSPVPEQVAPTADLRTDVPKYRIYRNGELVEETTDLLSHWQDD